VPDFEIKELLDLALLGHYEIYRKGMYQKKDFQPMKYSFSLLDYSDLQKKIYLDGLMSRGWVKRPKHGPHQITADGINRIERELKRPNGFLSKQMKVMEPFADLEFEPVLRIELGEGQDQEFQMQVLRFGVRYADRLQNSAASAAPASDRIVTLDHNSRDYKETIDKIDKVVHEIESTNDIGDIPPDEFEARKTELSAGRRLLDATKVRLAAIRDGLYSILTWFASKFADKSAGELASAATKALARLFGWPL
jgi:hypothetical protein